MLAYVFWHWRYSSSKPADYQKDLRSFHETISNQKSAGYLSSMVFAFPGLPWLNSDDSEVYEDWYLVENSAALDPLDEAAVNGRRKGPHDQIAQQAAGGTGGLYRLRSGQVSPEECALALWFNKPAGMGYTMLYDILEKQLEQHGGSLWQRQMTLGPALEFCWHAPIGATLPAEFSALTFLVTTVWAG